MNRLSPAGGLDLDAIEARIAAVNRARLRDGEVQIVADVEALIIEVRALRTALRPFAALLHKSMDSRVGGDDAPVFGIGDAGQFTVGDVRRAAALLVPKGNSKT